MNLQDEIKQLLNRVEGLKKLSSEALTNSLDFKDLIEIHIHNLINSHNLLTRVFVERVNYYWLLDDKRCELINSIVEIEKYFDKRYSNTDINKMEQFIKGGCDSSHCRAEEIKEFITKKLKDESYKQAVFKGNTDSSKRLLKDKHTLAFGTGIREFFESTLTYFSSLEVFFDYAHSLGYIHDKNLKFENIKREYWDNVNSHSLFLKNVLIKIPVTLYVRQFKTVQMAQSNEFTKDNASEILNAIEIVLTEFENIIIAESKRFESLPSPNFTPINERLKNYKLTERETEVTKLLMQGVPDKKISEKLNISPNTTNSHITSILNKLGVKNRTQIFPKIYELTDFS